ncbi:hypothetical protein AOC36_08700 [Erysipelothrix larvae]|uniref:Uncharacterized protein n=1 Tax=Erysipelothrix larvae TaxID=1514105 RepID=A0A0X8H1E1_9FIRM|nr:hypothetical protein [Erysipelothrix larvae]AMC94064.1 hypothetical protein AOC36_08700 [Erysipelothrix larvae]
MKKKYGLIFMILIFFPYITPISTGVDTQPWALIFSMIVFIYSMLENNFGVNKQLVVSLLIALIATFSFVFYFLAGFSTIIEGIRSLLGYWSLFFIPYTTIKYKDRMDGKYLKIFCYIWVCVALIQYFIYPDFGISIMNRLWRSGNRGVTALAPEPAWLGRWGVFVIIINDYFKMNKLINSKDYGIVFAICILLIFLSASGMGIAWLSVYLVLRLLVEILYKKSIKNVIITILSMLAFSFMFLQIPMFSNSRAGILIRMFLENPSSLKIFAGVTLRLGNPIRAFYGGLIVMRGLGFGIGSTILSDTLLPQWLIDTLSITGIDIYWGGRVRGGLVSFVYELGIIGLVYIAYILFIFIKPIVIGNKKKIKEHIICFYGGLLIIFASQFIEGSMMNPLFSFVLGLNMIYLKENRKKLKKPV